MRSKVVIIEGSQGTGKSTISTILREQMPYTNLLRLAGTSDKTKSGKEKVFWARNSELQMIYENRNNSISYILDRSHISEQVFCKLGHKDYTFNNENILLNKSLANIAEHYDVYFILLTADIDDFSERLKRDKPEFLDLKFNTYSSIIQQEKYIDELNNLRRTHSSINCIQVNTSNKDPYDIAYDILSVVKN